MELRKRAKESSYHGESAAKKVESENCPEDEQKVERCLSKRERTMRAI